jgi:hypothetical protein
MSSWKFDDLIESYNFIEITITFDDGSSRWCLLTTPIKLLEHFKNETVEPPGINMRHLFIMKTLDINDIEKTLRHLDKQGDLLDSTIPLSEDQFIE